MCVNWSRIALSSDVFLFQFEQEEVMMTSSKTPTCERSSLMRLTITLIVLSSSYVSVFNRLTHCHILSPSVISLVSDQRKTISHGHYHHYYKCFDVQL